MSVKVGIIGAGGIANWHLEHLKKIKDVQIIAIADIVKENAINLSKKYGGNVYLDYHEMLNSEKLDAVYICIPPYAHTDQEILVAKKKIPFFVEKPIHLSLEKAKEIGKIIEKNKVITAVGYQLRYQDIIDKIKEIIKGKKIGICIGYWMDGAYWMENIPTGKWWGIKDKSGGQIVEQATHIYDMVRYLFGEAKEVFALGRKANFMKDVLGNYNIEDGAAVNINFKNGIIGTIFSACFLSCGHKLGLNIYTKELIIEYKQRQSMKIIENKKTTEISVGNDFGLEEDEVFINAVKTENPFKIRSTYFDSIKTLELTLAANKSMETGEVIKL